MGEGYLLLELAVGKNANARQAFLGKVLRKAANVRVVTEETTLKIRDRDDLTTKDETVAAIMGQISTQEEPFRVKYLRRHYSGRAGPSVVVSVAPISGLPPRFPKTGVSDVGNQDIMLPLSRTRQSVLSAQQPTSQVRHMSPEPRDALC